MSSGGPRHRRLLPQVREPPSDESFLRIAAGQSGALWRLAASVVACVAGLVVLPVLGVAAVVVGARLAGHGGYRFDLTNGVDAGEMLSLNVGLAGLIGVAALLSRSLYGVRFRWLSSVRPGLRWRWLAVCSGVAMLGWSLLLVAGTAAALASRDGPVTLGVLAFLVVVVMTTPLQAAGEEYVFRGLLLQGLGALRWPPWLCCGASGLLFAVAHLQFDPHLFIDRLLLGVAFAFLAVRTGGLESGIAIHAIKNIAVLVPTGLLGTVDDALDPQSVSWLPLIVDAVLLALVVPTVLAVARRSASVIDPAT